MPTFVIDAHSINIMRGWISAGLGKLNVIPKTVLYVGVFVNTRRTHASYNN